MMEADQGVQSTIQSLLELARIRLSLIVQALVAALESLAKVRSTEFIMVVYLFICTCTYTCFLVFQQLTRRDIP